MRELKAVAVKKVAESNIKAGTFSLDGHQVEFNSGFQVSFETTETNSPSKKGYLNDLQFNNLVKKLTAYFGCEPNLGYFEGVAELSFHTESLEKAMHIAKIFNQYSVWDWANSREILNEDWSQSSNNIKSQEA